MLSSMNICVKFKTFHFSSACQYGFAFEHYIFVDGFITVYSELLFPVLGIAGLENVIYLCILY